MHDEIKNVIQHQYTENRYMNGIWGTLLKL